MHDPADRRHLRWAALMMAADSDSLERRLRAVLAQRLRRAPRPTRRQTAGFALTGALLLLPLAALRTSARGENGAERETVTAAGRLPSQTLPVDGRYRRAFPGGIAVEVAGIGVATMPPEPGGWSDKPSKEWPPPRPARWTYHRADGTPVAAPLFPEPPQPDAYTSDPRTSRVVSLAMRISPPDIQDVSVTTEVTPGTTNAYIGSPQEQEPWIFAEGYDPRQSGGFGILLTTFPDAARTATARIGVASGPWKTLGGVPATGGRVGPMRVVRDPKRLGDLPPDTDRETRVRAFGDVLRRDTQLRFVAVDAAGRQYTPKMSWAATDETAKDFGEASRFVELTWPARDIAPGKIRAFRLQSRPRRWASYPNIALAAR